METGSQVHQKQCKVQVETEEVVTMNPKYLEKTGLQVRCNGEDQYGDLFSCLIYVLQGYHRVSCCNFSKLHHSVLSSQPVANLDEDNLSTSLYRLFVQIAHHNVHPGCDLFRIHLGQRSVERSQYHLELPFASTRADDPSGPQNAQNEPEDGMK